MYFNFIILSLFFFPSLCSSSITGTVNDTSGNPILHALVTFTSESDSSDIVKAVTDSMGRYMIDDFPTGIKDAASSFLLGQNYPNPFNPTTTIPLTLDTPGHVVLVVYNISGQRIRTLVDGYLSDGTHSIVWDAHNESGVPVGSGVYLYLLRYGGYSKAKKMLLLDNGGTTCAGIIQHASEFSAKSANGEASFYTFTVERFLYENYFQEHIDTQSIHTLDVTLDDSGLMVAIPGGIFNMGDELEEWTWALPVHTVTVSPFEMSMFEITNAQYSKYLNEAISLYAITATSEIVSASAGPWNAKTYIYLAGYNVSYPDNDCKIIYSGGQFGVKTGYETWPVVAVTWYGAKAFAEHYGIDLPREAEWEYASRWGNNQYRYGTNNGTISSSNANYNGNIGHPVDVGSYPANPLGLHDMSGNVSEWCADWYGNYTSESQIDPTGAHPNADRVLRGGSWFHYDICCRSAYRYYYAPSYRWYYVGFRVVRRPAQQ